MDNSIWAVAAVGTGAVMTPLILDVDVAAGSTGETIMGLISPLGSLLGVAFAVVCFGLLTAFFMGGGSDF